MLLARQKGQTVRGALKVRNSALAPRVFTFYLYPDLADRILGDQVRVSMSKSPPAEDTEHELLVEEKGRSFTDMFRSKVSKDKNRYQVP
jgi:hypothetical protein